MGLKKVLPLAIALWPIPILNGLVVGIASSEEESIGGSVKVATMSSLSAFAFYYIINEYVRRLPIIGDFLLLSGISAIGIALAVYLAIYLRVNSVTMRLTPEGLIIEY